MKRRVLGLVSFALFLGQSEKDVFSFHARFDFLVGACVKLRTCFATYSGQTVYQARGRYISYIHDACLFFQGFYFSVPPKITTQNDGSMVLLPDNPTIAWLFGVIDAGIESSDV